MNKVLVIDDSNFSSRTINQFLANNCFEVLVANHGKEGLKIAETEKLDCIVLDLLMPEMDGFEVLELLNEKGIKTPVIVRSADIQDTSKTMCHNLGTVNFLNKPVSEKTIVDAVNTAVGRIGVNNDPG